MPFSSRILRVSVARSSALHPHLRDLVAPVERDAVSGADWAARVAALAHEALIDELETWPKPGLVSPVDSGSHDDMDADTLRRSAAAIRPYLRRALSKPVRRRLP